MKYSKCPVCDKKGLYELSTSSHFYRSVSCRYCDSGWATHKWQIKPEPKWIEIDPDRIDTRIKQEKARLGRLANT